MSKFTDAFIFNEKKTHVLLIKKNRPKWQNGLYNGIGGHIEEGETPLQCVAREVLEETGLYIEKEDFRKVCLLNSIKNDSEIHVFTATHNIEKFINLTDEKCEIFDLDELPVNVVWSLRWLIEFSLDPTIDGDKTIISTLIHE